MSLSDGKEKIVLQTGSVRANVDTLAYYVSKMGKVRGYSTEKIQSLKNDLYLDDLEYAKQILKDTFGGDYVMIEDGMIIEGSYDEE